MELGAFSISLAVKDIEASKAFYEKLGRLSFRAHWGKYLPQPGSAQGVRYLTGQYPRFGDFAALRRRLDPDGVFLTGYWRRHLGIQ